MSVGISNPPNHELHACARRLRVNVCDFIQRLKNTSERTHEVEGVFLVLTGFFFSKVFLGLCLLQSGRTL